MDFLAHLTKLQCIIMLHFVDTFFVTYRKKDKSKLEFNVVTKTIP